MPHHSNTPGGSLELMESYHSSAEGFTNLGYNYGDQQSGEMPSNGAGSSHSPSDPPVPLQTGADTKPALDSNGAPLPVKKKRKQVSCRCPCLPKRAGEEWLRDPVETRSEVY